MAALDEVHGWLERELPSLLQEYGVPAASVAAMQRPQVALPDIGWGKAWGLGWDVTAAPEGTVIGHDGSTIGQSSTFRVIPGRDAAFAVLTNGGQMKGLIAALSRRLFAD